MTRPAGVPLGLAKIIVVAVVLQFSPRAALARNCAGDCDGNDRVEIHELLSGVGLALGSPSGTAAAVATDVAGSACPVFDTNLDLTVGVAELVRAVGNAIYGCHTADFCGDLGDGVESKIETLLAQMILAEKIDQMHGERFRNGLWHTADNERLGIPGFCMVDGPRGVSAGAGNATAFPVAMARGATWDPSLEERIGDAIGTEVRAKGGSVLLAPTINLLRHPRWGRAQETYGEDPLHLGRMGIGFIHGAQRHVVASAKHLALNSIEDTRFEVNVSADERTLREIYLPHFRMAVREGQVGSVMSAYNKANGFYAAENPPLLRQILKGDWGFMGFVESDWILGTRSTVASALAGLDIEMPVPRFYGAPLVAAVEGGEVPESVIDEAVRRVLRVKLCFSLDTDPPAVDPELIETPEHTDLALLVAQRSIVLLENRGGALPLDRDEVASIVVTGPLADIENIGDTGSSLVNPSYVVTALEGIRNRAGAVRVTHVTGNPPSEEERAQLAAADAVIIVAGLTFKDEGEGAVGAGDRETLDLAAVQEQLIVEAAALNNRVIVVLEGGSAITVENWVDDIEGLLMAWYPGQEGGNAIADVLFGDVNPSGKLPISFARSEADLPPFINDQLEVDYGYYHGYRLLDREQTDPRYSFGFGLSYTTVAYANLGISAAEISPDGSVEVSFDVTNTGTRSGDEIVQVYVGYDGSAVDRPRRDLKGFARVSLDPGQTKRVALDLSAQDLAYYDVDTMRWQVEPISYIAQVGPSSRELPLEGRFSVSD